jgi:hypothetical protein
LSALSGTAEGAPSRQPLYGTVEAVSGDKTGFFRRMESSALAKQDRVRPLMETFRQGSGSEKGNLERNLEGMMTRKAWSVFVLMMFCSCVSGFGQLWSGVLSPDRATDWTKAGVPGGIPSGSWDRCGAPIAAYGSSADPAPPTAIDEAIAACPAHHYVQLGPGTFYLTTGITWGAKSDVALRGLGADRTFIVFNQYHYCQGPTDICIGSADLNVSGKPTNTANWTAGYARGTTTITLDKTPNLKVGWLLILDQKDDTSDNGNFYVCSDDANNPPCSLQDNLDNGQRAHRNETQIVKVTACGTATQFGEACNGGKVTITPGLYADNWSGAKAPGAWWATKPVFYDGVENLSLDHTYSIIADGIEIANCYGCWVSGVRSLDSAKAHVELQESAHVTVQNSYFYLTQHAASQSYGVETLNDADVLIVNNIMQYIVGPWMINGACPGCVVSYNYATNDYYTLSPGYVLSATSQHTAGIYDLLYEGNIGPTTGADNFHGTHDFVTLFRNYFLGYEPSCWKSGNYPDAELGPCLHNLIPVEIRAYGRYFNLVGNVLGQPGVQTGYTSGENPIYLLDRGSTQGQITVGGDPLVTKTLLRWGNWDAVTKGVRWCGTSADTGWSTICGGTPEVPAGLSMYANKAPTRGDTAAGQGALPASFYLASRPSWWSAAKPWPMIGPDVTHGNVPGVDGHANTNSAEDCYTNVQGGPADGSGPARPFNAAVCYGD